MPGSIPRILGWGSFLLIFAPTYDVTDVTRIRDVFRRVAYTVVFGWPIVLVFVCYVCALKGHGVMYGAG